MNATAEPDTEENTSDAPVGAATHPTAAGPGGDESRADEPATDAQRPAVVQPGKGESRFREEAVRYHLEWASREGEVLRLSPRWLDRAWLLAVAVASCLGAFCALFSADELASAPALVERSGDRLFVTATFASGSTLPRTGTLRFAPDGHRCCRDELPFVAPDAAPPTAPGTGTTSGSGPIVVRAALPGPTFVEGGQTRAYEPSMTGRATVVVGRRPLGVLLWKYIRGQ